MTRGGNRVHTHDATPKDGLPEPPEGRSNAFYERWAFLLNNLPADALRRVDAVQLAILVDQLNEIDDLSAMIEADPGDLKARSLRLRIAQQVTRLGGLFGLTPSDRQRLKIERPEIDDNPIESLLAMMGGRLN